MTVTLTLREDWRIGWSRGKDVQGRFTVDNARPLDQALPLATAKMARGLEEDGHDGLAICHLMGQRVRCGITDVFDPAPTVVRRTGR